MKTKKTILLLPRSKSLLTRRYRKFLNSFETYMKQYRRKLKTDKKIANISSGTSC